MATALIIVDVQADFIDGSLGGEGRDSVIEPLIEVAADVDYVVASMDWHPADHCSFSDEPQFVDGSWPVHCVEGTPGADLAPAVLALHPHVFRKGTDREQEAYSAFDGHDEYGRSLLADLSMRGVDRVYVGGLVTEKCVRATALDAVRHGFITTLVVDGCAALDERTEQEALDEMIPNVALLERSR